jgi:hypothetical protein
MKWYIDRRSRSHLNFASLDTFFLTFSQFPIRYDEGVEVLTSCHQNIMSHTTNHIHEWCRRWTLFQFKLHDSIFLDWFLKFILPILVKDVASNMSQTKDKVIFKA